MQIGDQVTVLLDGGDEYMGTLESAVKERASAVERAMDFHLYVVRPDSKKHPDLRWILFRTSGDVLRLSPDIVFGVVGFSNADHPRSFNDAYLERGRATLQIAKGGEGSQSAG